MNNTTKQSATAGFTLIEMMIVLAVLVTLILVAAPGFQDLIRNNRMISEIYAMRATLNQARSEALSRRAPVVVCATLEGEACGTDVSWRDGYMTFVDTDNNNTPDPNDPYEEIIQWNTRELPLDVRFYGTNTRVRFDAQGTALLFDGNFVFCHQPGEQGEDSARGLSLSPAGSVSAMDPNDIVDIFPDDFCGS